MPFTQKHTKYSQAKSTITYNLHIEIKKKYEWLSMQWVKKKWNSIIHMSIWNSFYKDQLTDLWSVICRKKSSSTYIFYWSCKKIEYVLLANGGE